MGLFGIFKKKKKGENFKKIPEAAQNNVTNEDKEAKIESVTEAPKINEAKIESAIKKTQKIAPEDKLSTKVASEKTDVKNQEVDTVKPTTKSTTSKKTGVQNKEKLQDKVSSIIKGDIKEDKSSAKEDTKKVTTEEKNQAESYNYTGRFEINRSKDGKKFFFNLYASNKVGIATSQMYSTSQNALNGVKSVIANAAKAPIEDQSLKKYETLPYPKWEIYVDNGGKYRFRLNASNGSCVCHSQGYTTKSACKNGIDSIIRSSKNAEIDKTYINKKDEE